MIKLPHPIPYQGSKRLLASVILGIVPLNRRFRRLYEPFAGAAAITIAAASKNLAKTFVVGDTLAPLIEIWRGILTGPSILAESYAAIWSGQQDGNADYYSRVREEFNASGDAARLLYLLARCVKNSPRWNRSGAFNQSEDRRRLGMNPSKMRREIEGAHHLLVGRTKLVTDDFITTMADAGEDDLVYLDPPWQGTSGTRDQRYHQGLERDRLIAALDDLNRRRVPWILSYDGRCGEKTYGAPLPEMLQAHHLELEAGRSSQATLNGVKATTVESLYVSLSLTTTAVAQRKPEQASFLNFLDAVGESL